MIALLNRLNISKLFFILFFFILLSQNCHSTNSTIKDKAINKIVDNEIWEPIIILYRSEQKVIKATSKKLYKDKQQLARLVGNVEIDMYDDGKHISVLYSDSAQINERNNNLIASGNVIVVSDSGYTLRTNKINWDNSYKLITAEDSVMFTTSEKDTLYGIGFESDSDLEEWRIFKPVGITRSGI